MDQIFDINRFGNLLWRSIVQYKQVYIRFSFAFLAAFIILGCCTAFFGVGAMGIYGKMLNILILFSPIFVFFRKRTYTSHFFEFTLPASVLEKFLARLFNCIFILPVYGIIISLLFIGVAKVIPVEAIRDVSLLAFTELKEGTISQYWNLIAVQSVYLCGSYFFKDSVFGKTISVLMGVFIIALIMVVVGVFLAFDFSFGNFQYGYKFDNPSDLFESSKSYIRNILYIIQYIIPVGLWFASFFKLKETEI